jgi:hypothetical protein
MARIFSKGDSMKKLIFGAFCAILMSSGAFAIGTSGTQKDAKKQTPQTQNEEQPEKTIEISITLDDNATNSQKMGK